MSAATVLTTATVPLLRVPTQWDPLVVHVTILTVEMAERAIYWYQVIKSPSTRKVSIY